MRKYLFFLFGMFVLSCSNDDSSTEYTEIVEKKNKIDLKIDGISSNENIEQVSAFFSCGQSLNVTVKSKKNNVTSDLLSINVTKEGDLQSVYFADLRGNFRQDYYSPDFIPSSTIAITDFEFIENQLLKFKFSGEVFRQKYNLLEPNHTLKIDGSVEITEFSKNICNTFINFITLDNNIKFSNISRISQGNLPNLDIRYEGNSLNGYHINIKNLTQNLPDMPLGTYSFSNNSTTEKIEFKKYIGLPKSFSHSFLIPSDWLVYETQGSFTIVEKTTINGFSVVKIKLNFTASSNGNMEHTFTDADFVTAY